MPHHTHMILVAALAFSACDAKSTPSADTSTQDTLADSLDDTPVDVPDDTATDASDPVPDPTCHLPDAPCAAPDIACHDTACTPPRNPTCIAGHVVDEAGLPIFCQGVVACTSGTCYPGNTDETGFFSVPIPASSVSYLGIYFPGSPPRHTPFCRYTDLCDGANRLCDPYVLRLAPSSGTPAPDNETLTADITVTADDGAVLTLPAGKDLKLPIGAGEWMALTRYPIEEDVPCFIDPDDLPVALYVVTPYDTMVIEPGTRFDPVLAPAELDLPNTSSLAANAPVQFYVLGGVHPEPAGLEEGLWGLFATGTVSADGARIRTDPGQGIGYLTWFGVYLAP